MSHRHLTTCGTFACWSACIAVVRLRDSSQKSADLLTHLLRPNCVARGACANHSFASYISLQFLTQSLDSCISVWAVHSCSLVDNTGSSKSKTANYQLTCLTGLGVESQTVKLLMYLLRQRLLFVKQCQQSGGCVVVKHDVKCQKSVQRLNGLGSEIYDAKARTRSPAGC